MTRVQFDGEGHEDSKTGNHISKPVKRMRWATQRAPAQSGLRKRMSIVRRFHRRTLSGEEAHQLGGKGNSSADGPDLQQSAAVQLGPRTIYMNIPIPDDAKDENGHIKQHFGRNKIRTAKYTPLSFVPKNLWFQFHNIANVYFLFIIILGVCLT